jgi:hypothetical protein
MRTYAKIPQSPRLRESQVCVYLVKSYFAKVSKGIIEIIKA